MTILRQISSIGNGASGANKIDFNTNNSLTLVTQGSTRVTVNASGITLPGAVSAGSVTATTGTFSGAVTGGSASFGGAFTVGNATFTTANQLRIKNTAGTAGYAALIRKDTDNFFLLMTNLNDADGNWNGYRPLTVNLASGSVSSTSTWTLSNASTSVSSTTGALTVAGGVGIGGDLHVAGTVNLPSDPTKPLSASTKRYTEQMSCFRNRIINGDMRLDQRNEGAAVTPTAISSMLVDRFAYYATVASRVTFQQIPSTLVGFRDSLRATVAAAATTNSANLFLLYQNIEGYNVSDLLWGTAQAKPIGISFRIKVSFGGTYAVTIRNADGSRSYVATFFAASNVDTPVALVIPGNTTGTWATGNLTGISLTFDLGSGTAMNAPLAGSWALGNYTRTATCVTMVASAGRTMEVTGLQVEVLASTDSTPTPFEQRPVAIEAHLCLRYFTTYACHARGYAAVTTSNSATQITLPQIMRAMPTVALVSAGTSANVAAANVYMSSSLAGRFDITSTAVGDFYALNRVYSFDAEL